MLVISILNDSSWVLAFISTWCLNLHLSPYLHRPIWSNQQSWRLCILSRMNMLQALRNTLRCLGSNMLKYSINGLMSETSVSDDATAGVRFVNFYWNACPLGWSLIGSEEGWMVKGVRALVNGPLRKRMWELCGMLAVLEFIYLELKIKWRILKLNNFC